MYLDFQTQPAQVLDEFTPNGEQELGTQAGSRFAPADYRNEWSLVREIDERLGVRYAIDEGPLAVEIPGAPPSVDGRVGRPEPAH